MKGWIQKFLERATKLPPQLKDYFEEHKKYAVIAGPEEFDELPGSIHYVQEDDTYVFYKVTESDVYRFEEPEPEEEILLEEKDVDAKKLVEYADEMKDWGKKLMSTVEGLIEEAAEQKKSETQDWTINVLNNVIDQVNKKTKANIKKITLS